MSPNSAFLHWSMQDQLLLGAINSALSEKMRTHVTQCATSHDAWITLETLFMSQTKARTMQVHYQLATLKKGSLSIADYYRTFQTLCDALAIVGQPLNGIEKVSFLLAGLGSDFDPFITSVTNRAEPLSVDEIYGHLLSHEMRLEQHQATLDLSVAGANFATRGNLPPHSFGNYCGMRNSRGHQASGHGFSFGNSRPLCGRGRGPSVRGFSSSNSHSNCPLCQVCNRHGHIALDYYNRFNESYCRDQPSQAQAYLSAPSNSSDQNWYLGSEATHHLTSDLANLNIKAEDYLGLDQIRVGNSKGLSIKHIGTTRLSTPSSNFDLLNILHVPQISKNLISVQKFTSDTNTFFEFYPSYFLLKDRRIGKLLHGLNRHGLYQFFPSANKHPRYAMVGERVSAFQWHS
jgi:hypothetical protein